MGTEEDVERSKSRGIKYSTGHEAAQSWDRIFSHRVKAEIQPVLRCKEHKNGGYEDKMATPSSYILSLSRRIPF